MNKDAFAPLIAAAARMALPAAVSAFTGGGVKPPAAPKVKTPQLKTANAMLGYGGKPPMVPPVTGQTGMGMTGAMRTNPVTPSVAVSAPPIRKMGAVPLPGGPVRNRAIVGVTRSGAAPEAASRNPDPLHQSSSGAQGFRFTPQYESGTGTPRARLAKANPGAAENARYMQHALYERAGLALPAGAKKIAELAFFEKFANTACNYAPPRSKKMYTVKNGAVDHSSGVDATQEFVRKRLR